MKKQRILLLLLLGVLSLLLKEVKAQNTGNFYFSNLGLKDGLSQISVVKILQDSKGFMWFATRNGLNRYDGSEFIIYKHVPGDSLTLCDNYILSLAEDSKRNLWIGTAHGLNKLDLKTNHIKRFDNPKYGLLVNAQISSLFVDSFNRLWVGTTRGLFCYISELDVFQQIDLNGMIKGESIGAILETQKRQMLIGTNNKGMFVCDMNAKVQKHITADDSSEGLLTNNVSTLYEDSQGNIWGGGNTSGLFRLDLENGKVQTFHSRNSILTTNSVRCIAEVHGLLLVGTFDGLYQIVLSSNELSKHADNFLQAGGLSHFSVYSLFVDKTQTIWVGTYAGGVSFSNGFNNRFAFHDPVSFFDTLFGIYGNAVCYGENTLYIATEGRGLLDYNLKTGSYQYFLINNITHAQYGQNIIKSLLLDGNLLYCGTSRGVIYRFDIDKKKYSLFYKLPKEMSVYGMLQDDGGGMYIIGSDSKSSLMYLSPSKELQILPSIGSARCILKLKDDVLLIGTRNNGLVRFDVKKQERISYSKESEGKNRLLSNYVTSIVQDSKGRIWVGTFGGGLALYDDEKGIVKTIVQADGLLSNDVCAIVEDNNRKLWISLSNGISEYFPEENKIINYSSQNGIGIDEFTPHSGTLLPGNGIYFSGNNGFVTFNPEDLQMNPFVPPLVFTRLAINGKEINVGDMTGILPVSVLDDVESIDLKYNENNISIDYCALNYVFARQNQYAVFLKGYDKDWNYVGRNRQVTYTNLSPGTYELQVKAANNDRIWNPEPRKLRIEIHPPFWETWYAYTFYVLTFISLLALIMYYMLKKQKLESALLFQQKERKQLETFHQEKIRMFTNFSHELRTPLTLIIAPLQELISMPTFSAPVKNKIGLIYSNANRLLLLVNQFLDLRKNQEGKLTLHITHTDFYPFMLEVYYAFCHLARNKSVELKFERKKEESVMVWLDKVLIEKVVFNLLSNAIKFTPNGGEVSFSFSKIGRESLPADYQSNMNFPNETEFLCIHVADTGIGIPDEEVKNIFNPFYQVDNHNDKLENLGTGIGLSLTSSIVHLHHGYIEVSKNIPVGTVFNVYLPVSSCAYDDTVISKEDYQEEVIPLKEDAHFEIEKKWTILLAEDNDEVRRYVKECLTPYFYVIDVDNGKDALDLCYERFPNLILSDIMMPKMDGLELCSRVKNDLQLEHIPVILVTAKSMVMQIKEGFFVGADDYIVKPFSIDVLIYRINNLLESREKLKKMYGKKFSPESVGIEVISGNDRFTQQFYEIVEKHLTDPDLNIEIISKEMGLSRANFYRKLKAITELSPTELIRNKRLEIAAKLLLKSDYSVSEIAFYTGFNSHSYFTNCFKAFYGYSPSEWVQKHKTEVEQQNLFEQ